MTNKKTLPPNKGHDVLSYKILSNGNEIPTEYQLMSINIDKEVNCVPVAKLVFADGDASRQTFDLSSGPEFEPGNQIEIKLGYSSDDKNIFKGIVIKHSIKIHKNKSVLLIECKDKAVKMTAACKNKYTLETKDSDIIEELIDNYGLEKDVSETTVTHKQIVQYSCTDWNFMLCRADVNGLLCFVNDGKITVSPPEFEADAALTIQYGVTVHDLNAEIDARLQYKTIKGTVWNYTDQELSDDIEAEEPGVPDGGNLSAETLANVIGETEYRLFNSAKIEVLELQAWVNAAIMKNRLAKIRGTVTTNGTAAVLPGQLIQLNGVGDRFEGKLFVTGVRHEVTAGNWLTTFQFGINPEWFAQTNNVQQPLAGALLPAIQGMHIGIVTQLENDPESEDRILVKIPVINNDENGIWCRVASLDAGENRGAFFRPEIDDEVIVGFINNDPRHGVVLGMMNSSTKPAPIVATDDNHEKGYVSRSRMKMIFNDDVKSFSLETPSGNKFLVTEEDKKIHLEDQNGNKITMNENGITIESIKDIILKANNNIKAEAVNVDIEGSAQSKLKGGAGAELSSSAITEVKGAMVIIN